ncbi:MAG: transposase [Richelia sp. CSU_2_1]|nr:transposase [Richelia sp. CSU_2_1]
MLTILNYAQALVYTMMDLMPSKYQQKSLRALLCLFLEATGQSLPQHCQTVSASAISRFLNHYHWPVRAVIRVVRAEIIRPIKSEIRLGRRPILTVILDMTTLEKVGKFSGLGKLIRVYNGKRGLHLVVLYVQVGRNRVPWGFRVYRGKGELAPVKLAQRLLKTLPKTLTADREIRVLADSAFGSIEMLEWVKKQPRTSGIFGVRSDRRLTSDSHVSQVPHRGQQVVLMGLDFPVTLSWYWLERDDGKLEKRFVISTKPLSAVYITMLGRRRWQIEGFFKTIKHRFGLHQFGQGTLLGVYRWILLSFIAYFLARSTYNDSGKTTLPDWGAVAQLAAETLLPSLVVLELLINIKHRQTLVRQQGFDITVSGWQYG